MRRSVDGDNLPLTDFSVLPRETTVYGPGYDQNTNFTRLGASLTRAFTPNFNAELSALRTSSHTAVWDPQTAITRSLYVDTNPTLPSGAPNPNLRRTYVEGLPQVNFTDQLVSQYAQEIAQDEIAHVNFLRAQLGASAVAQPAIDVGGTDPNGAFSKAAQAAGLVPPGTAFDPYANDENFLLGAYIFEDVGVSAYKGAAPLITSKVFLEAAAGILAVEAYHAGLIRTVLYGKGIATPAPALIEATEKISDARDSLDGPTDLDQGVRNRAPNSALIPGPASNIVPTDANALAYSRSAGQVLNIVYLNRMAVDRGGFFPAGVNGNIKTSAAN